MKERHKYGCDSSPLKEHLLLVLSCLELAISILAICDWDMLQINLCWEIWLCEKLHSQLIDWMTILRLVCLFWTDHLQVCWISLECIWLLNISCFVDTKWVCSKLLDKDLENKFHLVVKDKLQQLCCLLRLRPLIWLCDGVLVSRQELWPSFLEDWYGVVIGLGSKLHEKIDPRFQMSSPTSLTGICE